jgi:hypothetical protein
VPEIKSNFVGIYPEKQSVMNKPKKIIIAGAHEFPEGGGGAPRCMHMLAKGFASHGHSVLVATTYGSWEGASSIKLDGLRARCFGNRTPEGNKIHVMLDRIRTHLTAPGLLFARDNKE